MEKYNHIGGTMKTSLSILMAASFAFLGCSCATKSEYLPIEEWKKNPARGDSREYKGLQYKNFTLDRSSRFARSWHMPASAQTPFRAVLEKIDPRKKDLAMVGIIMWDKTFGRLVSLQQEKADLDQEFRSNTRVKLLSYESVITEKFGIGAVEYELTGLTIPKGKEPPIKIYSRGYRFVWPKNSVDRFSVEYTETGSHLSGNSRKNAEEFLGLVRFSGKSGKN